MTNFDYLKTLDYEGFSKWFYINYAGHIACAYRDASDCSERSCHHGQKLWLEQHYDKYVWEEILND